MKKLMALCLLACSFHSLAQDNKPFFQSKSYNVYLSLGKCTSEDIECDQVTYHAVNKNNHHQLTLKGSTLNIGPSRDFRGYIFRQAPYTYVLAPAEEGSNDNSAWFLQVTKTTPHGDDVVFRENGSVSR